MIAVFVRAGWLVAPVLASGLVHVAVLKTGTLASLEVPLDRGRTFRGRPILGPSKTWRGVVLMTALTACAAGLQCRLAHVASLPAQLSPFGGRRVNAWLIGAVLGLGYCAGELPNSFLKRRLGIPSGAQAKRFRWFQYVVDQTDSVAGCLLALRAVYRLRPLEAVLATISGTCIHMGVDRLMSLLGLRDRAPT
jgi:hypothetical protein